MTIQELDQDRATAFAERVAAMLNDGTTVLMLSIGHRTGLFDALAEAPGATSAALAARAGLQERYVREWLGAMVAARIVEMDPATGAHWLPPEHAASLTRAAAPANLAVPAQFLAVLGAVEDRIVDCFVRGGGVPYEAYPRFHEVMAEESAQTVVAALDEHVLPLVPGITERLERGIDVLDVGCGSGRALLHLARRFPRSRFVGLDMSAEAIARAGSEAAREGLTNVRLVVGDAAALAEEGAYDFVVTFDAVHDQARPDVVLAAIRRALRPGGVYLAQEIRASSHSHENVDHPFGSFLYTISCMHCMTVSLAQGGMGLGATWGHQTAERMMRGAGFTAIDRKQLDHDPMNDWYVCRAD